mmetsp:Transcript_16038/g.29325  ORF Transcript_16038/g.29325 Transcript_16038/m.29325 type:complete len:213 (+) Transcript_16038:439-1077(+)
MAARMRSRALRKETCPEQVRLLLATLTLRSTSAMCFTGWASTTRTLLRLAAHTLSAVLSLNARAPPHVATAPKAQGTLPTKTTSPAPMVTPDLACSEAKAGPNRGLRSTMTTLSNPQTRTSWCLKPTTSSALTQASSPILASMPSPRTHFSRITQMLIAVSASSVVHGWSPVVSPFLTLSSKVSTETTQNTHFFLKSFSQNQVPLEQLHGPD